MTPSPPLSQYGDRWFRISEKQLYALMQGWTHTNILDKKPILQTVCDQSYATHTTTQSERNVLNDLKDDLKTRFISSSNQWSKGRNSGLLECCNIIDDYLRTTEAHR